MRLKAWPADSSVTEPSFSSKGITMEATIVS